MSNVRHKIYARSIGMLDVISLFPARRAPRIRWSSNPSRSVSDALWSDWCKVGTDLNLAVERIRRESVQSSTSKPSEEELVSSR